MNFLNFSISLPHWLFRVLVTSILIVLSIFFLGVIAWSVSIIWPIWWPRLINNIPVKPESLFSDQTNAYAIFVDIPKEVRPGDSFPVTVRGQFDQSINPVFVGIELSPADKYTDSFIQKIVKSQIDIQKTTSNNASNNEYIFDPVPFQVKTLPVENPPSKINLKVKEIVKIDEKSSLQFSDTVNIMVDQSPFPYSILLKGVGSFFGFVATITGLALRKNLGLG